MIYNEEFKEKVRKLFPPAEYKTLHQKLEEGDTIVGRYLDDMSSNLASTSTDAVAKKELYKEWFSLYKTFLNIQ